MASLFWALWPGIMGGGVTALVIGLMLRGVIRSRYRMQNNADAETRLHSGSRGQTITA